MRRAFLLFFLMGVVAVTHAQECSRGYVTAEEIVNTGAAVFGDFNEDGLRDMATLRGGDLSISDLYILLNRGHEVYQPLPAVRFDLPLRAAADVDGDGHLDLIARSNAAVGVLRGHGDGTFAPVTYFTGRGDVFRTADMNGDGKPDFASVDGDTLSVNEAQPDGTYQTSTASVPNLRYRMDFQPMTVGDFDGDGDKDVASLLISNGRWYVQTFRNDGAQFTAMQQVVFPVLRDPPSERSWQMLVEAADVDGDGAEEIIARADDPALLVLHLNGTPRFELIPADFDLGSFMPVGTGDFDGDGRRDIVLYNHATAILWGRAPGETTFQSTVVDFPLPSVADVNGDGVDDLFAARTIYGHRGSRDLRAAPVSPYPLPLFRLFGADFDGDGEMDLAARMFPATDTVILTHAAASSFLPRARLTDTDALAAADLDGDGNADLVTSPYPYTATGVAFGRGDFSFTAPLMTSQAFIGVATLAGGGKSLVVRDATGVSLARVSGDRTYTVTPIALAMAKPEDPLVVVDLDGDGDSDLLSFHGKSGVAILQDGAVWREESRGFPLDPSVTGVLAADFDRDGRPDLVVLSGSAFPTLSVWMNQGDGTYRLGANGFFDGGGARVTDVDHDGWPDLLVIDSNEVQVSRNDHGMFVSYATFWIGANGGNPVPVDVDGDEWEDVALASGAGIIVLRSTCVDPPLHIAASNVTPAVGEPVDLIIHARNASADLIYIREGSTLLQMLEFWRNGPLRTVTYRLPSLSVGEHVFTVDLVDEMAGKSSAQITVRVGDHTNRRRAGRH